MTKKQPAYYAFGYQSSDRLTGVTIVRAEIDDLLTDLSFDERTLCVSDPAHPCSDSWTDWRNKGLMDIAQMGRPETLWEKLCGKA